MVVAGVAWGVAFGASGRVGAEDAPAEGGLAAASAPVPNAENGEPLTAKPVAPPAPAELDAAIRKGVAFLLHRQNPDGSWGSARNTKDLNIYAPVPGAHHAFRSAVTALCISALLEVGPQDDPAVQQAVDRGEAWLVSHLPELRRATPDALYNVWGHGYAIQALVRLLARKPEDAARQARLKELVRLQFQMLERYESVDGGWGYYDFRARTQKTSADSTSFVSGAILVAFHEARQAGLEPPPKLVERAVASIRRQLKHDFSYLYGEYLKWSPVHPINRPGGSLGRSQCCNLALRHWGDARITDAILKIWLDRLVVRNLWLDMGRKRPIPHESWFAVAGYFYYFGHYYAALCIHELPAAERPHFQAHLARILLPLQEKDGSWWDYPLYDYHQQYGTAFALMSLQRCRPAQP